MLGIVQDFRNRLFWLLLISLVYPERLVGNVTFQTLSGTTPLGYRDGPGSSAQFRRPSGLAIGSDSIVFLCDTENHVIRVISEKGEVGTLAGVPGRAGYHDGAGNEALFSSPKGVAVLPDGGGLVVADTGNHVIRKITMEGDVITVSGIAGSSGFEDGNAGEARFNRPEGVFVDHSGAIYVADTGNHTVRYISTESDVLTLAGSPGNGGFADGIGERALFHHPADVLVLPSNAVLVADSGNHVIREVKPNGEVSTFSGTPSVEGYLDSDKGNKKTEENLPRYSNPTALVADLLGNDERRDVFVVDAGNTKIRKINRKGEVSTHAEFDAIVASSIENRPTLSGVAVAKGGGIFVSSAECSTVFRVFQNGNIENFAGHPAPELDKDGGEKKDFRKPVKGERVFQSPKDVAVGLSNNLYVADSEKGLIKEVSLDTGAVTEVPFIHLPRIPGGEDGETSGESNELGAPSAVIVDNDGNLYISDAAHHVVWRGRPFGNLEVLIGTFGVPGSKDGPALGALLSRPAGLAISVEPATGRLLLWLVDSGNHCIRRLDSDAQIETWAGNPRESGAADGLQLEALFSNPHGVVADAQGNLFVTDTGNHAIRRIDSLGNVVTWAGELEDAGVGDGPREHARFFSPTGIAIDAFDNLYVSDFGNHLIRKISRDGMVSTLGGSPGVVGGQDGSGEFARFSNPMGLAVVREDTLFVADLGNSLLRRSSETALMVQPSVVADLSEGFGHYVLGVMNERAGSRYDWALVRRPPGSFVFTQLENVSSPRVKLDEPGTYTFRLTAGDLVGGVAIREQEIVYTPTLGEGLEIVALEDLRLPEDVLAEFVEFTVASSSPITEDPKITVHSSNEELVANKDSSLAVSKQQNGEEFGYAILLRPQPNASGFTVITVTAELGGISVTESFRVSVNEVNDPPAISAKNLSLSTDEDTPVTVKISVEDLETETQQLELSVDGYDPELIEGFEGIGKGVDDREVREVTIIPKLNQFGKTKLRFNLSDGESDEKPSIDVELEVLPVNDPPTISGIDDPSIEEDQETKISFTVFDIETESEDLNTTVRSLNPELVDEDGLDLQITPGGDRELWIEPKKDQRGKARIILAVTDGELWDETLFTLVVRQVNDAPTISEIVDQNISVANQEVRIPFEVEDLETPNGLLEILPPKSSNQNVVSDLEILRSERPIDPEEKSRFIRIPGKDGRQGVTEIEVVVRDEGGKAARTVFELAYGVFPEYSIRSEPVFLESAGTMQFWVYKRHAGVSTVKVTVEDIELGIFEERYPNDADVDRARAGVDYIAHQETLQFRRNEERLPVTVKLIDDQVFEVEEKLQIRLSEPTNGAVLAEESPVTISIIDDEVVTDPFLNQGMLSDLPMGDRTLKVSIEDRGEIVEGYWRFVGETRWRRTRDIARGLVAENYIVELRPLKDRPAPPPKGVDLSVDDFLVFELKPTEVRYGELEVLIEPGFLDVGWRLQTEEDVPIGERVSRVSGEQIPFLIEGEYVVVFDSINGYVTPDPRRVRVIGGQLNIVSATYFKRDIAGTKFPQQLSIDNIQSAPHAFNGLLRGRLGFGSGMLVKDRVVLTAAHVVVDEGTFLPTSDLYWLQQFFPHLPREGAAETARAYEPPGLLARGVYVLDRYSAQRINESGTGKYSPKSRDLDAASVYFLSSAGRGYYSGYLNIARGQGPAQWLGRDRTKILIGYPRDQVNVLRAGRMHATFPQEMGFTNLFGAQFSFFTDVIDGYRGNSGGGLYAELQVKEITDIGVSEPVARTRFYPAAIFLGGDGNAIVRVIDSDVVELIKRAEIASGAGSGGGTPGASPPPSVSENEEGILSFTPPAEGGTWAIFNQFERHENREGAQLLSLKSGDWTIEYKAGAVLKQKKATIVSGQTSVINLDPDFVIRLMPDGKVEVKFKGKLYSADSPEGPYREIPGAVSPYQVLPSEAAKYYQSN